jgi:hypothetical protein
MVLDLKLENYQQMVRASLDRAKQYTWAKTAKETLESYRELEPKENMNIREEKIEEEKESGDNEV